MRILVIGGSGLVGSHVLSEALSQGHIALGTYYNHPLPSLVKLDMADEVQMARLFESFEPDWVVYAAGWTWVDGCEKNPERAIRENCDQPTALARLCKIAGCRFSYFSTSYVFDGSAGPYSEKDIPNPINIYAKSKWLAEEKIQDFLDGKALIPRVICVWGVEAQRKNFAYQVIDALRNNKVLKLPSDQLGNPTWAGDIAYWLIQLMQSNGMGVWNLAGDRSECSRVEWFHFIKNGLAQHGHTGAVALEVIETLKLGQIALRPLRANLLIDKITSFRPRIPRHPQEIGALLLAGM